MCCISTRQGRRVYRNVYREIRTECISHAPICVEGATAAGVRRARGTHGAREREERKGIRRSLVGATILYLNGGGRDCPV